MRTDSRLNTVFRRDREWQFNARSGKLQPKIDRFKLHGRQRLIHSWSGHERNHLFLNRQGKKFTDISAITGLDNPADSRSFVLWDYDRDGWQDLAMVNANSPLLNLYHNDIGQLNPHSQSDPPPMIAVRFVGGNKTAKSSKEFSNRDGYGATVVVSLDGLSLRREHRCGEGFAAQNSRQMIIGIGNRKMASLVTVQWPSGKVQSIDKVPAGTLLIAYEDAEEAGTETGFVLRPYQ